MFVWTHKSVLALLLVMLVVHYFIHTGTHSTRPQTPEPAADIQRSQVLRLLGTLAQDVAAIKLKLQTQTLTQAVPAAPRAELWTVYNSEPAELKLLRPVPTSLGVGIPGGREPPKRCESSTAPKPFPGLNFCPAPEVPYMLQQHLNLINGMPLRNDMLFLDAMFIMEVIRSSGPLSNHLINLGAAPSSIGEDNKRKQVAGDDTTALNYAGWHSINFDVPSNREQVTEFYAQFGDRAKHDTTGTALPDVIATVLRDRKVPVDVDFLKIDVDSFECDYLESILRGGYRPKVIDIECASSYPPPIRFRARYVPDGFQAVAATPFGGCSLQEAIEIVKPFGYTLIQYPLEDGWFVLNKYAHLFGPLEKSAAAMWYAGNPYLYGAWQLFEGTADLLQSIKMKEDPQILLAQIKKAHQKIIASKPQIAAFLNYNVSIGSSD